MSNLVSRRGFIGSVSVASAALSVSAKAPAVVPAAAVDEPLALLGGKAVRTKPFPSWPIVAPEDRTSWVEVFDRGRWNRGPEVAGFEQEWSEMLGTPFIVATASGTAALYTSLRALDVGPGDEVIVPPYTFVATINVVLLHHAMPVFVDSDRKTFQIDANKIEAAISDRTRCIIPVHLGGNPADMDTILEVGRKHGIPVLEDACQAHLGEWKGRKVGTWGSLGCFSFQASKNLNCGEGGSIATSDPELAAACASFHDAGRPYQVDSERRLRPGPSSTGFSYVRQGDNRRLTEFQGGLLRAQLRRLEEQSRTRETNAARLTAQLKEIPGIAPAESYPGTTRNALHLYMFRYDPEAFAGVSRDRFLAAMKAEGIPCSGGYSPLNKEAFLKNTLESRGFRRIYGESAAREFEKRNRCPENDRLCREAVWLGQTQLLGPPSDMDEVATAVRKIQRQSHRLA